MDPRGNAQEISNAFSPCLAFTGQDGLACYFRWFFACRRRNPRYSVTNYTSLLTVQRFCFALHLHRIHYALMCIHPLTLQFH